MMKLQVWKFEGYLLSRPDERNFSLDYALWRVRNNFILDILCAIWIFLSENTKLRANSETGKCANGTLGYWARLQMKAFKILEFALFWSLRGLIFHFAPHFSQKFEFWVTFFSFCNAFGLICFWIRSFQGRVVLLCFLMILQQMKLKWAVQSDLCGILAYNLFKIRGSALCWGMRRGRSRSTRCGKWCLLLVEGGFAPTPECLFCYFEDYAG